jgi:hypothetical protein
MPIDYNKSHDAGAKNATKEKNEVSSKEEISFFIDFYRYENYIGIR